MQYKCLPSKKAILIDNILTAVFVSSYNNFIEENDNILILSENLSCNILSNENNIKFILDNSAVSSNIFLLKINFDILFEFSNDTLIFSKNNITYVLNCENCLFEIDNEQVITVRVSSDSSYLGLYYYENYIVKAESFYTTSNNIDENTYMPEFSISIFDVYDALTVGFDKSRPVRQGVPIISTVPSFVDSNSSSEDQNYFNLGKGPDKKTIWFRIVCNKLMENLSLNQLSEMKLKIYMPNGLDTVKTAIYRPMYFLSNDAVNKISIYYASHDFYIQGVFDGIEYVDGYMYCDVQVPMTVTKSISVEFDYLLYD